MLRSPQHRSLVQAGAGAKPTAGPFSTGRGLRQTGVVVASETTKQKDTMKVEKLSWLVLTLGVGVLV